MSNANFQSQSPQSRQQRMQRQRIQMPNFTQRQRLLGGLVGLALVTVVASAFYRQVVETEFLQDQGEKRFVREREIPARRGVIMDRNGEPLAISTAVATFTANPRQLVGQDEAITALARVLELEPDKLREQVESNRQRGFIYLRRRMEHQTVAAVKAVVKQFKLQGIGVETEYRRFYPGGEVFGQVIGYTDVADQGLEGIELAMNASLRAEPGSRRVIQDGHGQMIADVEQVRPPRHGQDLRLSLDRRLQFLAYRELKRAVLDNNAVGGSAVLMDVASGEILAMVNQPAFNPNVLRPDNVDQRRNRAVTDVFEPGSTVKPLVMGLALESGRVRPDTPINTSPGQMAVGRNRVRDVHNYGQLNATSVITKSSNVGIVKVAFQLPPEALWQLYDHLGFGHVTAVNFPGERKGRVPAADGWSQFEHATLAFGYGLNVTAVQLAQAYATVANDGVLHPPTLLHYNPRTTAEVESPTARRIFSPTTAAAVRAMMETVVSDVGTAKRAGIDGYRIAGKTGTARKAGPHGYAAGLYQAVFAGMAPASHPRFVMVIMVDEPHGAAYYGGLVAAPVFSKTMQTALRLYNVAPDDPTVSLLLQPTAPANSGKTRKVRQP
ncbi:peptidoglycan D,D-transpeptidase FtsI family protein [Thiospirillum jenense]|uniref:Peptidoglycan D,D-transpeptidase FtsI n=1 Tax=Thiospirillum jenense TaxID=1653858 RepID=A0A839HDG3_9GAMM|nr:penicillin-binding protein 2 [Thiospirillum jenense]MBB1126170.1 penicillin-binding protein 2 [Thiospirillum jenense]